MFEAVVVDNDSEDDSVSAIKKAIKKNKCKNVNLIANPKNSGFGGGNNFGAKRAKGDYLCFLNNDTTIEDKGLFDMVSYMDEHKDVAILGGQLRNADGSLQHSSGKFYTLFNAILLLLGMQRFGMLDKNQKTISEVDWVKGALLMIRRNIFEELRGFDENIFMYTEDMELCYRAMKKGYKIYFYPFVHVTHAEQGSSNRTFAIVNIYKNLLYFYKKHRPKWEYIFIKFVLQLKAKLLIAYGTMIHNSYFVSTYEQALAAIR